MSLDALLQAATDKIRTAVGTVYNATGGTNVPGTGDGAPLTLQQCDIQFEGRPPGSMGQWYISLYEGGVESSERALLKEICAFDVFLTCRTGVLPRDRWAAKGMGFLGTWDRTALTTMERLVILALHGQQDVRIAANKYLGITQFNLATTLANGDSESYTALDGSTGSYTNSTGASIPAGTLISTQGKGDIFTIPPYYLGRPVTYAEDGTWIGNTAESAAFLVRKLRFGGALRPQGLAIMK